MKQRDAGTEAICGLDCPKLDRFCGGAPKFPAERCRLLSTDGGGDIVMDEFHRRHAVTKDQLGFAADRAFWEGTITSCPVMWRRGSCGLDNLPLGTLWADAVSSCLHPPQRDTCACRRTRGERKGGRNRADVGGQSERTSIHLWRRRAICGVTEAAVRRWAKDGSLSQGKGRIGRGDYPGKRPDSEADHLGIADTCGLG